MRTQRIPSVLNMSENDLTSKFRHRAALVRGGKVIGFGQSTLGGCRYLSGHMGRSCHAEVNACKMLPKSFKRNSPKVAKNYNL